MAADGVGPLYSSIVANCVFNVFLSYTAIMLNIVTIYAMRNTSSLPKPLRTLLLSLAVSDIGVGLLVQPIYVVLMVNKLNSPDSVDESTNSASSAIANILSIVSFFGVFSLSVDRFLAIHLHLRYQELVTHKRVVGAVISVWVLSVFLGVTGNFWAPTSFEIILPIIMGFCFICTAFVYWRIYFAVRRHTNQMQALQVSQAAQNGEVENAVRLRKFALSTFYVYLVFLVCYLPEYCTGFSTTETMEPSTTLITFRLYTWTLVCANSSLNPVIYCWRMRHIRHAIMDTLRNIFPRQK